jgi:hypothetical protein
MVFIIKGYRLIFMVAIIVMLLPRILLVDKPLDKKGCRKDKTISRKLIKVMRDVNKRRKGSLGLGG